MFKGPARLIRTFHADRPRLSYSLGLVLWVMTTLVLLYSLKTFLLADGPLARVGVLLFDLGVLAVHSAMSVYLGDGWKIRYRKLDRENRFIRFLGRFG